jgi:hypothetical protein
MKAVFRSVMESRRFGCRFGCQIRVNVVLPQPQARKDVGGQPDPAAMCLEKILRLRAT